ncbi:MAG: hypothetical protein QOF76_5402 [Solirubrobacteraceae bacterium]|nr:hypothetical protein [Solirubrobacteraceae bacterium]
MRIPPSEDSWSARLQTDRRTELIGRGLALDTVRRDRPDAPWAPAAPGLRGRLYLGHMTDLVDPAVATIGGGDPRVVDHHWTPAAQATVYRAGDSVLHEERFVLGDAFVCDLRVDGPARVSFAGPLASAGRHTIEAACLSPMRPAVAPARLHADVRVHAGRLVLGLGASAGAASDAAARAAGATAEDARRAFDAALDAFAPALITDDDALARLYAYRCFLAWRGVQRPDRWFADHPMPGELLFEGPSDSWFSQPIGLPLSLQVRELRWLRAPAAVAGTLAAWSAGTGALRAFAGDPVSAAMDFARHQPGVVDELALAQSAIAYLIDGRERSARIRGGGFADFPVTVGSWVTGTEFAPDFFVDSGLDHRESEAGTAVDHLRQPGQDDSPEVSRLGAIHRVDVDSFHLTMLRAVGRAPLTRQFEALHSGPDGIFRSARPDGTLIDSVVGFDAVIPFSADDFSPAHRDGLLHALSPAHLGARFGLRSTSIQSPGYCPDNRWIAGPAAPYDYPCCWNGPVWNYGSSWALLALGRVARSTEDPRLSARFGELWRQWSSSHFTAIDGDIPLAVEHLHPDTGRAFRVVPEYFHSAWLAPFLEHVVGVGHPSGRTAFAIADLTLSDVPHLGDVVRVDVEDGVVRTN